MRVAYLGPPGTFTQEALRASAPRGAEEVPYSSVYETVMAVHEGGADRAVVPIENALEGGVTATLDALATDADRVRISGEVVLPIEHCVVAARELDLAQVTRVVSHPQATAQCARFLRERLARAERMNASSTAEAVISVRDSGEPWVALGSRLSADLYRCPVLAAGVEDHPDNATRFVWLAPEGEQPDIGDNPKTSVVFWGAGDESPGWLVGVLGELASRDVNLTRIESRPRRIRLGHYMFFADMEGAVDRPPLNEALSALGKRVETIRVLGCYPAATSPGPSG